MADREVDVLLIGGGVASASCAEELRERDFDGSVLLVGREADPPYERPPCSKEFLRGTVDRPATYLHAEDWWSERSIDVRTRVSVMKLDTEARGHVRRPSMGLVHPIGGEAVHGRQGYRQGREQLELTPVADVGRQGGYERERPIE